MVARSKGKMIKARLTIPCPFCGDGVKRGTWIKLSNDERWCHPMCTNYIDAGKSFKDMQLERRIMRRVRELKEQEVVERQRQPAQEHRNDYL